MTDHSPEPWREDERGDVVDANDTAIMGGGPWDQFTPNGADTARIVACVNACKGIPTERLEQGQITIAFDIASDYADGEWWAICGPKAQVVDMAAEFLRDQGMRVEDNHE